MERTPRDPSKSSGFATKGIDISPDLTAPLKAETSTTSCERGQRMPRDPQSCVKSHLLFSKSNFSIVSIGKHGAFSAGAMAINGLIMKCSPETTRSTSSSAMTEFTSSISGPKSPRQPLTLLRKGAQNREKRNPLELLAPSTCTLVPAA